MISSVTLTCITLALPVSVPAQIVNNWGKVDTVTAGECDDLNPSLIHNAFFTYTEDFLWVVFERHTSTESQIASKRFNRLSSTWDSSVVVLSSRPAGEEQRYPDYSEVSYYDTTSSSRVMRLAAWQVRNDNRWQIYYSTFNDGAPAWSKPSLLVPDSIDNTCVQVRPIRDSTFIITWKRANTVMALIKSISTSTPAETLAVSSSDSIEYDICTNHGTTSVIWTSNVQGRMTPLHRTIIHSPQIQFATPETLQVNVPCSGPHLTISPGDRTFLFETRVSGRWDVIYSLGSLYSSGSLSNDPFSDNRNARSFSYPYILIKALTNQNSNPSALGLTVYEKYRGNDSSLIFIYGPSGDTVRTPGHNWNPLVGSQPFSKRTVQYILVVWESNRSGRAHIYSILFPLYLVSIARIPQRPFAFELSQNYPNPFNPTTTIRYALPSRTHVTLSVFNTLGQLVSALVDCEEQSGYHEVKFDGSNFASGVYFYRIEAGSFVKTMKLLLIR